MRARIAAIHAGAGEIDMACLIFACHESSMALLLLIGSTEQPTRRMKMTTNQTISARILALVAAGASLAEAVDAILGAGTYAKMADDIYTALRAA